MWSQSAGVRAMVFNSDGRTILTAMQDSLKVFLGFKSLDELLEFGQVNLIS